MLLALRLPVNAWAFSSFEEDIRLCCLFRLENESLNLCFCVLLSRRHGYVVRFPGHTHLF